MINRRAFIKTSAAAGLAGTAAFPAPAIAQGVKEIRMVTTWPRGFAGLGSAAERLATRITVISGGRLAVKMLAAGELVPAFESFDAVARGDAEMYHGAEYYWDKKHPCYPFFTTVPMGMTAAELEAWIHFGGGQELWDELAGQFGLKCLLAANTGVQMGGWFQSPIKSLDQIKALKMRIPGLGGEVIRRLGGQAVNLPGGQILAALKSGEINATEWIGPWNDMEFGLHQVLKDYMFPGFHEPGTGLSLGINRKFWDGLAREDQELIKAAACAENDVAMAEFNARNGAALAKLVSEHGVKLHLFPREVWVELAKVSAAVVAEAGEVDGLGRRIVESYRRFQKEVSEWQQISDISYTAYKAIVQRS